MTAWILLTIYITLGASHVAMGSTVVGPKYAMEIVLPSYEAYVSPMVAMRPPEKRQ